MSKGTGRRRPAQVLARTTVRNAIACTAKTRDRQSRRDRCIDQRFLADAAQQMVLPRHPSHAPVVQQRRLSSDCNEGSEESRRRRNRRTHGGGPHQSHRQSREGSCTHQDGPWCCPCRSGASVNIRSFMSGSPSAAIIVGNQSKWLIIWFDSRPGSITFGHLTTSGTRKPPSQLEFFSLRNGAVPPSGQKNFSAPLSVGVHNDSVVGDSKLVEFVEQLADVTIVFDHAVRIDAKTGDAFAFLFEMREDVHPGGVPPKEERFVLKATERSMKSSALAVTSSSTVSMRLRVNGPVSSTVPSAVARITPRGPNLLRKTEPSGRTRSPGKSMFSGSSSALRWYKLPKNSSRPWFVGKCSSRSPRWFFPNWPVAYPFDLRYSAMVGSRGSMPSEAPGRPTLKQPRTEARLPRNERCTASCA